MSYGIGRIPRDADDDYEQTKQAIEHIDRTGRLPEQPDDKAGHRVCRSCGQGGFPGSYPFSTAPNTGLCDDCL